MKKVKVCRRCYSKVEKSDLEDYAYQCFVCDEDLDNFETTYVDEDEVVEYSLDDF